MNVMAREAVNCEKCGGEMNCHAEKVVYDEAEGTADLDLGGPLLEWYACPACGASTTRPSVDTA